jgi:hypothetical protein
VKEREMQKIVIMFVVFAGCATVGKKFDTTHVNDIQKGTQTKAEILGWFGPAQSTTQLAKSELGCTERWTYMYAHSAVGGSTVSEALVVDFDAAGKVCDNAYSKK